MKDLFEYIVFGLLLVTVLCGLGYLFVIFVSWELVSVPLETLRLLFSLGIILGISMSFASAINKS